MATRDRLTLEEVLAAFDEHLRRTRGVCAGTRRNYCQVRRRVLAGGVRRRAGGGRGDPRSATWPASSVA